MKIENKKILLAVLDKVKSLPFFRNKEGEEAGHEF